MSEWVEALPDEEAVPRPERRGSFRLQCALKGRLPGGGYLHLVNLSVSGFRATGPEEQPDDEPFPLTLELEEFGIPVLASRVWSRPLEYGGQHDAGYRFVELGEAEKGRLHAFIRARIADEW